jgi:myo-inositol-1(or 4)-monophosphatase
VIYDPTRDELFTAEQGRGALAEWRNDPCLENRYAEGESPGHGLSQPQAAQESEYLLLSPDHAAYARSAPGGLGCARSVQRSFGRFDGFWEFNLNPWDTAAGVLIVEEAGGKVTRFDGSAI